SLVAFNKRAQEEIAERTDDLPMLGIRTLNAIGLAIVNGTPPFAPQPKRWNTIGEIEVRRIIGKLVSFPRRRNADPVAPWIEALSVIRLGLVDPSDVEARYDGDVDGLAEMWPSYRAELARAGAVDFDDQIYRALEVLLTQPDARATAQRACRVMLVDEFQDLTPAHVLLIRLLASPGGAVFGVGDDDQTIYGYNGADPAWLIDFDVLFPGAESHPLEVNYRCPAGIVDAVDRLLRHNTRRVHKTIRASSVDPSGWRAESSADPVATTVASVRAALTDGATPSDIAVLARVNAVLAPVQVALGVAGIPVNGGVGPEFAERTAIRTVLAWIALATTGAGGRQRFATDDVREALRRPSRSFHPRINDWIAEQASLDDLERLADRLNNDKDADRLRGFTGDIAALQRLARSGATTSRLVTSLIDDIGLAGAVTTLDVHRRGMNRAAQSDDLTAIGQLARLHDDPATFGSWLRSQLAVRGSNDGVVLATVHRVKGQEWPHVVVHLADDEQYPHRLADDVEEERRLFHVGITRASSEATIVTGPHPSPFIAELSNEPSQSAPVRLHATPPPTTTRSSAKAGDPQAELDEQGQARYDRLVELRHELRDGKPAYVVFDNKTAVAIAAAAPTTLRALGRVKGIGPTKLDKYGEAILRVINA
ncbi:MAG: ATP-dependent DNA helicase UvrD2, partial [Acidimicrobiales bacterium]